MCGVERIKHVLIGHRRQVIDAMGRLCIVVAVMAARILALIDGAAQHLPSVR